MSASTSVPPRSSLYRQYSRGSSGGGSSSSIENLPPRTLSRVAREVRDLIKTPPEGIRLVVDEETGMPSNLGDIVAELEGPQGTPYESKFFRLKLVLGADFPQSPPRGFFLTKIYHPNVDMSTGAICVNTLKKDWQAETTFSHVLSVIRCLLIVPFPESSLNDEAGKLFMESYDEYSKRAHLMADVHGRPFSSFESDEKRRKTESERKTDTKELDNASQPSARPSGLPLGSKNANSLATNASKNSGGKGPAGKMNKKKSLKRL
eukprot:Nitzschia sp. Nitz4//scaffold86_size83305//75504//76400//NITZ4_005274-RA/size83305-snap-gene-0.173-mRNA-1//-1//CDS//3329559286//5057//frame0